MKIIVSGLKKLFFRDFIVITLLSRFLKVVSPVVPLWEKAKEKERNTKIKMEYFMIRNFRVHYYSAKNVPNNLVLTTYSMSFLES